MFMATEARFAWLATLALSKDLKGRLDQATRDEAIRHDWKLRATVREIGQGTQRVVPALILRASRLYLRIEASQILLCSYLIRIRSEHQVPRLS